MVAIAEVVNNDQGQPIGVDGSLMNEENILILCN